MFCSKCGSKNDENANFCLQCGNRLNEMPINQQVLPDVTQKKKKKPLLPIIFGISGIAIIAIILVICLMTLKKEAVLDNILASVKGTLKAESFDFTITAKGIIDDEEESSNKVKGTLEYNLEKEKLAWELKQDDGYECILYDGILYELEDGEIYSSEDISDELDMIFEYYEDYNSALDELDDMDWEEAIEDAGISNYIEADRLQKCVKKFVEKLNDKAFYKKVCNDFEIKDTKDGKLYSFDVDVPEIIDAVIDIFEPAIDYDIDDIKDELLEPAKAVKQLEVEIGMKDNKLTSLDLIINIDSPEEADERNLELSITLDNYNKAVIDEDKIEDLIAKSNQKMSEEAYFEEEEETYEELETVEEEYTTLDVWVLSYDGLIPTNIQDCMNRFMADNPYCTINLSTFTSEEYKTQLDLNIATGEGPDIFYTYGDYNTVNDYNNGYFYDLTEFMNQDYYSDRFFKAALSQITYNGSIIGVPVESVYLSGFYYNKQLFDSYGLNIPTTIEELEQICDTLKSNGITPFALGNSYYPYSSTMYYSYLAVRKGGLEPLQAALEGTGSFEDECFNYAGTKIQEWVSKGYFNEDFNSLDDFSEGPRQLLYGGQAGMYLMSSWMTNTMASEMSDFSNTIGFFEFPAYTYEDSNAHIEIGSLGGTFYCVNQSCENPDMAFKAITYLVDDIAVQQNISFGYIPPVNNYFPEDKISQLVMNITRYATSATVMFDQILPPQVADVFRTKIMDLFSLTTEPEEANKSIEEEMQLYLGY